MVAISFVKVNWVISVIGKLVYVVFGFRAAWSDKLLFRGGTLLVRENYNLAASVQL